MLLILVFWFLIVRFAQACIFYEDQSVYWNLALQFYHMERKPHLFDLVNVGRGLGYVNSSESGRNFLIYDDLCFDLYIYFNVPFSVPIAYPEFWFKSFVGEPSASEVARTFGIAELSTSQVPRLEDGRESLAEVWSVLEEYFLHCLGLGNYNDEAIPDERIDAIDVVTSPTAFNYEDDILSDVEGSVPELHEDDYIGISDEDPYSAEELIVKAYNESSNDPYFLRGFSTSDRPLRRSKRTVFHEDTDVYWYVIVYFFMKDEYYEGVTELLEIGLPAARSFIFGVEPVTERTSEKWSLINYSSQRMEIHIVMDVPFRTPIVP